VIQQTALKLIYQENCNRKQLDMLIFRTVGCIWQSPVPAKPSMHRCWWPSVNTTCYFFLGMLLLLIVLFPVYQFREYIYILRKQVFDTPFELCFYYLPAEDETLA